MIGRQETTPPLERMKKMILCQNRLVQGSDGRRSTTVLPEENERKVVGKWKEFVGEMKKVGSIATPMVVVTVSQYLLQVVSMSMAGHLGEISLSSAAIATSFTNVTGFSLLFGMAGALETLCGQAYGAEQYKKLGIYTYAAIVSLLLVCVPVSVLWIFLDKLLLVLFTSIGKKLSPWTINRQS
ncbi:hypothetical protein RHSIM_Rhsim10G0076300 [Rhododendron simsii]|uniref:MATE efflux family protein n=1 Tax=Rhododendron simsii TaxID=118357 RepID=A0A834GC46_RHOSS|nr:hypothetical protein RHSIM_Rhsim10G0076300 [Rhododendron simsii]